MLRLVRSWIIGFAFLVGRAYEAQAATDANEGALAKASIRVSASIQNSGPLVPSSYLLLGASVRFSAPQARQQIGTDEHPWWSNVWFALTEFMPQHMDERDYNRAPIRADRRWRVWPAAEDPLNPEPRTGLETDYLRKTFVVDIAPRTAPAPGTIFLVSAVLDTRQVAKQAPQIQPLTVAQIGATLVEVADTSRIRGDSHLQTEAQSIAIDRFRGALYLGDFRKAEAANAEAVQHGLNPVCAQLNRTHIALYRGEYEQALAEYELTAIMDAEAREKDARLEPLVWPGMLEAFREKIAKKLTEDGPGQ